MVEWTVGAFETMLLLITQEIFWRNQISTLIYYQYLPN